MTDPIAFARHLCWSDIPPAIRARTLDNLRDTLGIALAARNLPLARIIHAHATDHFGGPHPHLLGPGTASPPGIALALGMTIDALDGHDGYNPAKGHVGCGAVAGLLALAVAEPAGAETVVLALLASYEIGSRLGPALHASTSDYHTSGAWIAPTIAVAGARILGLTEAQTAEAAGIAEYHGPRSQMMRCIDHPTMLKDGSGWGAMAGVSALYLARDGFTGAPSLLMTRDTDFSDLGTRWRVAEQYYKPYPVCRWAQPPVEAVLALRADHDLRSENVDRIDVETFHESVRLATSTPHTTEEAQYSTSFPCAVAMVRGAVTAADVTGERLRDPEILRLSEGLTMSEHDHANAAFPARRYARVRLQLRDGRALVSDWTEGKWDVTDPPSSADLRAKFDTLTAHIPGAAAVSAAVDALPTGRLAPLLDALRQSSSPATTALRAS